MSSTIISGISAYVSWHTYNLAFTHIDNAGLSNYIATQLGCTIATDSVSTVAFKWWSGAINMSDVSNYAWGTQVAGPALVRYISPAITLSISMTAGVATYVTLNLIALAVFKMTACCRKSEPIIENPPLRIKSESQLRNEIEQTMLEVIRTTIPDTLQATITQMATETFKTLKAETFKNLQFHDHNLLESQVNQENEKKQRYIRIQTIPRVTYKNDCTIPPKTVNRETCYEHFPVRNRNVKYLREDSFSNDEDSSSSEEGFFAKLLNFCPGASLPKKRRI